jgi:magnesium chelatase subunit I
MTTTDSSAPFPFSAIVGQDEMKLAILVAAVDPGVGGVLVFGDRGTGKSTAVRALAGLLPKMRATVGCAYACDPAAPPACADCGRLKAGARTRTQQVPVTVVDLPLGATEDRVVGALDLERALARGEKAFEPGLLARAHRGFLYIDEVNLLEDHLVDLLIDVAASGQNVVEREGLSVRHPARFVLVGSGNPEEGELRPQLLDRFGLAVDVRTPTDLPTRVEVVRRRDAYERDPAAFAVAWKKDEDRLRRRILAGRDALAQVEVPDAALERAAQLCLALGTDGLRGELTLIRAGRALAAFDGAALLGDAQLRRVARPALRHRLRRNPLDDTDAGTRVERTMTERGRRALRRDAHELHIGPSALRWDGHALTVEIDEIGLPWPRRVRGTVRLVPAGLSRWRAALDDAGRHRWGPIAPAARVELDLHAPRLHWQGHGYFDSNEGDEPIVQAFTTWDWARAPLADGGAAVVYDVRQSGGRPDRVIAARFGADGHARRLAGERLACRAPHAQRRRHAAAAGADARGHAVLRAFGGRRGLAGRGGQRGARKPGLPAARHHAGAGDAALPHAAAALNIA